MQLLFVIIKALENFVRSSMSNGPLQISGLQMCQRYAESLHAVMLMPMLRLKFVATRWTRMIGVRRSGAPKGPKVSMFGCTTETWQRTRIGPAQRTNLMSKEKELVRSPGRFDRNPPGCCLHCPPTIGSIYHQSPHGRWSLQRAPMAIRTNHRD